MKIIITGGCGYVGTELTKFLLSKGHKIKVIDTQWFGNYHKKNKNLIVSCADGCLLIDDYKIFPDLNKHDMKIFLKEGNRFE